MIAPDVIYNARTGQRMTFLEQSPDLLRTESVNPPTGVPEPLHVHPHQETTAEIVSGSLRFVVDGAEHRLGPGDSLTIPANTPHQFVNDGATDVVWLQEARPALRSADFFRTYFEIGSPSVLQFAALGPVFSDEIRLVKPPWPVQRVVFALLGPVARLRYGARWMSSSQ